MNEQLVVKNFGPIKDATVDFKRVTVFIGPTGGGKSTLAKLAAILRQQEILKPDKVDINDILRVYAIKNFESESMLITWTNSNRYTFSINHLVDEHDENAHAKAVQQLDSLVSTVYNYHKEDIEPIIEEGIIEVLTELGIDINTLSAEQAERIKATAKRSAGIAIVKQAVFPFKPSYIPSERVFLPAVEYSWAGLMRDDIGLPKLLLEFANGFSLSRKEVSELEIPFLKVKYLHIDGRDFIKIPEREEPLMLLETASGIQSVTPLLVLLEHLSRNTEQAQSFIIEEPELNLYPTAQQGLLNWLVEKCTKSENDLTITTHSPYILSSCNLLLEAYKVAQQRPELADEIDKIVPRACWLNPEEFAAYYVADGTVKPITDTRTHLIGSNELDAVSGDISDSFRQLLRLQKQKPASV